MPRGSRVAVKTQYGGLPVYPALVAIIFYNLRSILPLLAAQVSFVLLWETTVTRRSGFVSPKTKSILISSNRHPPPLQYTGFRSDRPRPVQNIGVARRDSESIRPAEQLLASQLLSLPHIISNFRSTASWQARVFDEVHSESKINISKT